MNPRRPFRNVLLLVLALLFLAACQRPPDQTALAGPLTDLGDIDQLQDAFETDSGRPRLLLILAPT